MLIDYASWEERKGIRYSRLKNHEIKLNDILDVAKERDITFQKGDLVFIRTGFTREQDTTLTVEAKKSYAEELRRKPRKYATRGG